MLIHWVAKDLVEDTADLHARVDLLMELFQLYVDTNLVDNEVLNKIKKFRFLFLDTIRGLMRQFYITHLASSNSY